MPAGDESTRLGRMIAVARAADECRDRDGGLPLHFGDVTPERIDQLFKALKALRPSDFEPVHFNRLAKPRISAHTLEFLIDQARGYLFKKATQEVKDAAFALALWSDILNAFLELKERRADD